MFKLIPLVWLYLAAMLSATKTCPVTKIDQYRYSCNLQGSIKDPQRISSFKKVNTKLRCAALCLEDIKCHSFRYVLEQKACHLFELHLENMNFTTTTKTIGNYNDRYCYSTDCEEIETCKAIDSCRHMDVKSNYFHFTNYACGYGLTSSFTKYDKHVFVYPGNLTACDAAYQCANEEDHGPFEVHFDLPSQQWICYCHNTIGYYTLKGYYTLEAEGINYQTFTDKNASVGASYGFWQNYT